MTRKEEVLLGSGDIYMVEYTGTLPESSTIKSSTNKIGEVSGGARLEYKPTFYTAKSDNKKIIKTIITDEEVTLKSGLMTWCGNTLAKFSSTARVDETTTGKRVVKIGGLGNYNDKKYAILFAHDDAKQGNTEILIVGQNQSGFTLPFAQDKETIVDAEFKALPQDTDGTLIQYTEYDPVTSD